MRIDKFEDIMAWQKAKKLTEIIYRQLDCQRDYSFRDQIRRASISIMNNIAEGFERKSNNELRHFLYIAKGSCGEVRSMLYVAKGEGYITSSLFNELYEDSISVSRLLAAFIKSLKI